MKPTDQTVKLRIVFLTAALALVGFFLEVGPIGGVFTNQLVLYALGFALPALGFLAYLALAAAAAVGIHINETEPTPKEDTTPTGEVKPAGPGEMVSERVRVRPELHQLRMLITALGGYALLKGISLAIMAQSGVPIGTLVKAFNFGFIYVALGWFVLWQFLRWYATRRRWIRLQDELIGGEVTRVVAVIIVGKVLLSLYQWFSSEPIGFNARIVLVLLLHLLVLAGAFLLWTARPLALRRTIAGLCACGGSVIVLTLVLAWVEYLRYRP